MKKKTFARSILIISTKLVRATKKHEIGEEKKPTHNELEKFSQIVMHNRD